MNDSVTFLNPQSALDTGIPLKKAYVVRDLMVGLTDEDEFVVARLAKPLVGAAAKAAAERKFVGVDPRSAPAHKITIKPLTGTGRPLRKRGRPPKPQRQSNGADEESRVPSPESRVSR